MALDAKEERRQRGDQLAAGAELFKVVVYCSRAALRLLAINSAVEWRLQCDWRVEIIGRKERLHPRILSGLPQKSEFPVMRAFFTQDGDRASLVPKDGPDALERVDDLFAPRTHPDCVPTRRVEIVNTF